jgi:TPR repeat protein
VQNKYKALELYKKAAELGNKRVLSAIQRIEMELRER